ncbi:tetratricopeptide repeat protein [Streptomyces sp. NPDC090106]|uniref:tetratricopeptide repeat protein n=1 Tax=Streptomyces sp. NPDC090106 TaxID=3365946 RepID=UPI00381A3227
MSGWMCLMASIRASVLVVATLWTSVGNRLPYLGRRAVEEAARHHLDTYAWQLAWSMANHLHSRGLWREKEAVHRSAMTAALRLDDPVARAYAHRGLSTALTGLGDLGPAREHAELAVGLFNALSNEAVRAEGYRRLGETAAYCGDLDAALDAARQALELLRVATARNGSAPRDRAATASALNSVGWQLAQLGRHEEGLAHCEEALTLCEGLENHNNRAEIWDSIGYALHHLGRFDEAVDASGTRLETARNWKPMSNLFRLPGASTRQRSRV